MLEKFARLLAQSIIDQMWVSCLSTDVIAMQYLIIEEYDYVSVFLSSLNFFLHYYVFEDENLEIRLVLP